MRTSGKWYLKFMLSLQWVCHQQPPTISQFCCYHYFFFTSFLFNPIGQKLFTRVWNLFMAQMHVTYCRSILYTILEPIHDQIYLILGVNLLYQLVKRRWYDPVHLVPFLSVQTLLKTINTEIHVFQECLLCCGRKQQLDTRWLNCSL